MAAGARAFLFYPQDFARDVHVVPMTLAERGAYLMLLCAQWEEGSVPADTQQLARILQVSHRAFLKLWPALAPCFQMRDGRLVQKRLDREREKAISATERASARGAAGAERRWHKHPPDDGPSNGTSNSGSSEASNGASNAQAMLKQCNKIRSDQKDPDQQQQSSSISRARGLKPSAAAAALPIFLHPWQEQELVGRLGAHADAFGLDEFLAALAEKAYAQALTFPSKESRWAWIQTEFAAEISRRGLPVAGAESSVTDLAAAAEAILRKRGAFA